MENSKLMKIFILDWDVQFSAKDANLRNTLKLTKIQDHIYIYAIKVNFLNLKKNNAAEKMFILKQTKLIGRRRFFINRHKNRLVKAK